MEKNVFTGKTREEAINNAKISLQDTEENLIIKELENKKGGLFKTKKVEIEVIEKREINKYIKEFIIKLLKEMGISGNIETTIKEDTPTYSIYSDNDALLIGKNGKNLKALSIIVNQHLNKELGTNYRFIIDVNSYKQKHEKHLEYLAKKIAREVASTKIEAKMDPMNSYERRIIHNILNNNKRVYTESEGTEPNRYVVIKPKGE